MDLLSTTPRLLGKQIQKLVKQNYNQDIIKHNELPSERDQNIYFESAEGRKFILKISNTQIDSATLELQNQALAHISANCKKQFYPQIYSNVNNEKIGTFSDQDGTHYYFRLLSYIPGRPLAHLKYHRPLLIRQIGTGLAQLTKALQTFDHPASRRDLVWDLSQAEEVIDRYKEHIQDSSRRALIDHYQSYFQTHLQDKIKTLRRSVVYNDANDYNILVKINADMNTDFSGFIDWGDLLYSYTLVDLAIASAYLMLGKTEPLHTAKILINAYHQIFPLTEAEIAALFGLSALRLCLSVSLSACRRKQIEDNPYLAISEQPAWELLEKLSTIHPRWIHYYFRQACEFEPLPEKNKVVTYLQKYANIHSVLPINLKQAKAVYFDLSITSDDFANLDEIEDAAKMDAHMQKKLHTHRAEVVVGGYREPRAIYTGTLFKAADWRQESRTVHIGMDLYQPAGTAILAPLDGKVHSFTHNQQYHDYGPTIILTHTVPGQQINFYTLYGHLSLDSLHDLYEGKEFRAGDQIAKVGSPPINGDWPPHLHFQVMIDMFNFHGDYPGVAKQSDLSLWEEICPDPNLILQIPASVFPPAAKPKEQLLEKRRKHFSAALRYHYQDPLRVVRGYRQYLYDAAGKAYLDMVNNVPHVGYSHPRVVAAACKQLAKLNTNTRYLYDQLTEYGERICELLPDPLAVIFLVNSGSEANDLALRLARAYTGRKEIIVLEDAYHGHLSSLIEISPYKFDGSGGKGAPDFVYKVKKPDVYRGPYKKSDPDAGSKYAAEVQQVINQLKQAGHLPVTFISESLVGCGGQIIFPQRYLKEVYQYVRAVNGICIADEVQVGFGRVGSHFWGFETQAVIPDIVTLGKPMGNGFPLAAVVTTQTIAEHFYNGMEYFNTFGGNPLSCAVGMAVLDVIEEQGLQHKAKSLGAYFKSELEKLKKRHSLIGDVRGQGLFIGVELIRDPKSQQPAETAAYYLVERMRQAGVLVNSEGPLHNVIKIKPPLIITREDIDLFCVIFDNLLTEAEIMLDK